MASSHAVRAPSAFSTLHYRDLRLLMLATTLQSVVMPLHFVTLTLWAIDRYPDQDVVYPGLIVAVRGVGMLLFSLVGGAIADRFERRKVLFFCEASSAAVALGVALCMLFEPLGEGTIVLVIALIFVQAATMGVDQPARAASIPAIVPQEDMAGAIGLNNIAAQLTFPIILPLTGILNGRIDAGKVFLASLVVWVVILPVLASLRYSSVGTERRRTGLVGDIREGLAYVRREPTVQAVLMLVFVLQVVGMPGIGMLGPVWGRKVLGLSKSQLGFVMMFWGLGALASSFFVARMPVASRRGATLCLLVVAFCAGAITWGYSRSVPLTVGANFTAGFTMPGAQVVAMIIIQHLVANEMRGRVMGLFPLIMGVSMLNVGLVSAAGQRFGLEVVVPALGWATLVLAGLIIAGRPGLRRVHPAAMEAAVPAAAMAGE
jgi:MFS family permease